MHARRKFRDLADGGPHGKTALSLIGVMYLGERQARDAAGGSDSSTALIQARQMVSAGTSLCVEQFFQFGENILASGRPPSDQLFQAASYAHRQKDRLRVFLGDPLVSILFFLSSICRHCCLALLRQHFPGLGMRLELKFPKFH